MAERLIPGGRYINEAGPTERQIPGGVFVNELLAAVTRWYYEMIGRSR